MKITIIAYGTRGDVQPLLALGRALQRRGHDVCMVAGANFAGWIESHGVRAAKTSVDIQALMEGEAGEQWVKRGTSPLVNSRIMRELYTRYGHAMAADAWNASQGADLIMTGLLSDIFGVSIAERLGARQIGAWLQPSMVATKSGAATFFAPRPRGDSRLNYWLGKLLIESFPWMMSSSVANRFRREILNLPPQTQRENTSARRRMLVLHGYSRHVIPPPDDWPPNMQTTGYWFLDESAGWQAPRELEEFLAAGESPICVGFGSMTGKDARPLTELLVDAVKRSGERAVLLSGWAGLSEVERTSSIFSIDAVPHEWLFPRVRAVIHHGGAGSTAAGLRAGVPTIIVPHMADQVFWGQRVEILGVGPRAIPRNMLTAARLAAAIQVATTDRAMKSRAAELGARIRSEDGIINAVDLIERHLQKEGVG